MFSLLLNIQIFSEEFSLAFSETNVLKILEIPWKKFMFFFCQVVIFVLETLRKRTPELIYFSDFKIPKTANFDNTRGQLFLLH